MQDVALSSAESHSHADVVSLERYGVGDNAEYANDDKEQPDDRKTTQRSERELSHFQPGGRFIDVSHGGRGLSWVLRKY
jgi:hypothetical protein